MKSDRSFLEGVYSKAEILENEISKSKLKRKKYYRLAPIAAMIVLIPTLYFINDNLGYREIEQPMMIRTLTSSSTFYFDQAEFIVKGETKEVKESKFVKEEDYIYTDIVYTIDEVLQGNIEKTEIVIRLEGGRVKKERVYQNMKSEFSEGEKSIVFLNEENGIYGLVMGDGQFIELEKDIFVDNQGTNYRLEEIKEIINFGGN